MLPFLLPPGRIIFRGLSRPAVRVKQCYSAQSAARLKVREEHNAPEAIAGSSARPTSVAESDGLPAFSTKSNDGGHPGESTLSGTPAKARVRSASPKRKTKAKPKKAPSEPREPSLPRTEIFLSKIQAEGLEPTTQDLERFRPAWIPDPLAQFDEYKVVYNDTVADLDRSFNREQLSSFVNSVLSFIPNKTARKRELINIMLAKGWGMPSPVQLEKERREQTEIKKQVFAVSEAQLFVLLGEDGTLFKSLASDHRAALFVESSPSLAVRAEATKSDLEELRKRIKSLINGLVTDTMKLPGPLLFGDAIVQSLSRQAGVFVQQSDPETLRMTAQSSQLLERAQRIATRAWIARANQNLVVSHSAQRNFAAPSAQYSMYPYAATAPLPWISGAKTVFRPRRVGEWLMGSNMGSISTLHGAGEYWATDIPSSTTTLEATLGRLRGRNPGPCTVTASSGHVVFTDTEPSALSILTPSSISGASAWPINSALNWVRAGKQRTTYLASPPHPLVGIEQADPLVYLRLTYRQLAISNKTSRTLTYEIPLTSNDFNAEPSGSTPSEGLPPPRMRVESVSLVDVVLPDRPMDLQLRVNSPESSTQHPVPTLLTEYTNALFSEVDHTEEAAQVDPSPPFRVNLGDAEEPFVLEAAHRVSRSTHSLPSPLSKEGTSEDWPELRDMLSNGSPTDQRTSGWSEELRASQAADGISVILESLQDLESPETSVSCSIQCTDPDNKEAWGKFLEDCDILTTHMYPSIPAGQRSPSLSSLAV